MAAPLGRPLFPETPATRAAQLERRVTRLERRAVGRWVWVSGIALSGDGTGIDAPTWTDSRMAGGAFTWQGTWGDVGDGSHGQDGLTRYRLGPSGIELILNATGGSLGDLMFTLINGFWDPRDGKQTFSATDDTAAFTCYTIVPRNDFSAFADVYAGRV